MIVFLCALSDVDVFVVDFGSDMSTPSVAQMVERSTVVVDTVRSIHRNRLVTS